MVTRLSDVDRHNMLHLFTALSAMDGPGIAKAVLSFSGQAATVLVYGVLRICVHACVVLPWSPCVTQHVALLLPACQHGFYLPVHEGLNATRYTLPREISVCPLSWTGLQGNQGKV